MKEFMQQLFEQFNGLEEITGFILFWLWVISMFVSCSTIIDNIKKGK